MRLSRRTTAAGLALALALCGCGSDGAVDATESNTALIRDPLTRNRFSVPAQWERQDAVWLAWWVAPYGGPDYRIEDLVVEMARALAPRVPVNLVVQDATEEAMVRPILARAGVDLTRVHFVRIPHNDFWMRDTGGIFTRNPAGEVSVVDFGYNFWGYDRYTSPYSQHDERIDRDVAESLGITAYRCSIIHEGGGTDVDGRGTAIVTEAVELQRNPFMTRLEIDYELRRCYGVRQVIWLPEGMLEDQGVFRGVLPGGVFTPGGTNGHTDEYVRFAPNNTILLAEVRAEDIFRADPGERQRALINRARLEAAYAILRASRDADGRPFRILRVPVAEPDYYTLNPGDPFYELYPAMSPLEDGTVIRDGDPVRIVSTTSYLNFLVTNDAVLVPAYATTLNTALARRKDQEAQSTIRAAYPGRQIVPIHQAIAGNRGAGGPHCMTQQQPASTNAVLPPSSP
jgi:agmatine deiminase